MLPSGVNVAFHFIQLLVTEVIVVSPNFGHVDLNIGHMVPNSGHRAPNFGHSDLNIGHRVPHPPLPDITLVVWIQMPRILDSAPVSGDYISLLAIIRS